MAEETAVPAVAPAAPEATTPPPAPPAAAPAATPEAPKANPWDDPAAARAEIERLRKENGANRTNAKAQAAEEARTALAQEIGKALGLVKGDEPADPVKLTEQLTAAGAEARQAKIELAVFRASQATDVDPNALLDSRTFLAKVATVDPSDSAAIEAAVAEAVAANPRLGKPVAQGMKPNQAQGRSASAPLGLAEQAAAAAASGDTKAAIRLKSAMALNHN
ncbi:MAG: hypothetical protein M0Z51_16710 [Propionibacterium sp.]|nr:hypothetical protein [Propionibacterium sp.]